MLRKPPQQLDLSGRGCLISAFRSILQKLNNSCFPRSIHFTRCLKRGTVCVRRSCVVGATYPLVTPEFVQWDWHHLPCYSKLLLCSCRLQLVFVRFFPCRLYGLLNLLYSGINTSEILPHSLDTNNVITTLHFGNCGYLFLMYFFISQSQQCLQ